MYSRSLGLLLFAIALAGCSTIRSAREAQDRVADMASGKEAETSNAKVNLTGYTLEDLVDFALTNRESVVQAELKVKDAHLAMKQLNADAPLISSTPWNAPKVNLSASYSESTRGAHFEDFDGKLKRGKFGATISLDLLVYDFGRHDAKIKTAAENVIAAELALGEARYEVFEQVTAAYFSFLEARSLLTVAEDATELFALHLEQETTRYEQGVSRKIDVTKAALDLSTAKDDELAAHNTVETSGAELLTALGIAADQATWHEVTEERYDIDRRVTAFAPTTLTAVECFDLGCTNYPAMRIARSRLRAAISDVDYAIADLKPSLSADTALNFSDPLWVWRWGVGATQNLFSGFRKTTAVDRAVVAMESAAAEVDKTEHSLSLAVSLAIAERDNARSAYETSEESVRNAKDFLELSDAQYKVGDLSRIDFQDSVHTYAQSLGTRVKAFYRGQKAESKLFRLIGEQPTFVSAEEGKSE